MAHGRQRFFRLRYDAPLLPVILLFNGLGNHFEQVITLNKNCFLIKFDYRFRFLYGSKSSEAPKGKPLFKHDCHAIQWSLKCVVCYSSPNPLTLLE